MPVDDPSLESLGCHGELHERRGRWQLLGNGHRTFSPSLMRFQRPDRWSPFAAGGINAYAYCDGDPINRVDPSGRFAGWVIGGLALTGVGAFGAAMAVHRGGDKSASEILAAIGVGLVAAAGGLLPALARPVASSRQDRVARGIRPVQYLQPRPIGPPRLWRRVDLTAGRFRSTTGVASAHPLVASPPDWVPGRFRVPSRAPPVQTARARRIRSGDRADPSAAPPRRVRFRDDVIVHKVEKIRYPSAFIRETRRNVPVPASDLAALMASRDPADDYIKVALSMDGFPP